MRKPLKISRMQMIITTEIKGKQVGKISELAGKTSNEIGIRENEVLDFGERSKEWRYGTPFKIIKAEIQMGQELQFKQWRTYLTSQTTFLKIKPNHLTSMVATLDSSPSATISCPKKTKCHSHPQGHVWSEAKLLFPSLCTPQCFQAQLWHIPLQAQES